MDVQKKLDEIVDVVGSARSMPMSASCVVNRADLLAMLEEVREALPGSLAQAQELIGGHEQLAEQARQEAERIIGVAHEQRSTLISDTAIARRSQEEADRILGEARRDAEEIRAEADDYVDSKLANFEVVLTKTIGSVDRGREKLLGRGPAPDEQGYGTSEYPEDDDAPEYSADPDTLIRRADDYVDAKLGAFEAVLSKTLDAVGRGRQKLLGRVASDDLGEHMAAQDAAGRQGHTSDEDYLAGLAELADGPRDDRGRSGTAARTAGSPDPEAAVQLPAQQSYTDPGYGQPATGYQEAGYPEAGYAEPAYQQQQEGYTEPAYPDGYPGYQQQQDGYGYQQDPYAYQQQGYDQAPAPAQPQGYDPDYGWQQGDVPQQQPGTGHPDQESGLDETSLFDTSMIDLDQLRRYEQGR